LSDPLKYAQ